MNATTTAYFLLVYSATYLNLIILTVIYLMNMNLMSIADTLECKHCEHESVEVNQFGVSVVGGASHLHNAMENNGVLNRHMIEQLFPLFSALQTRLMPHHQLHVYTPRTDPHSSTITAAQHRMTFRRSVITFCSESEEHKTSK